MRDDEGTMASRQLAALVLSDGERKELTSLAARRNTAQALALRARIVLGCADGTQNKNVAERVVSRRWLEFEGGVIS